MQTGTASLSAPQRSAAAVVAVLLVLAALGSGCSEDGKGISDIGDAGDTDADADSDTDSDNDSDTVGGTDPDECVQPTIVENRSNQPCFSRAAGHSEAWAWRRSNFYGFRPVRTLPVEAK